MFVGEMVGRLQGTILTPEEADLLIATVRGRTRARVQADNRPAMEEPLLVAIRAGLPPMMRDHGLDASADVVVDLLDEIDRLRVHRT